MQRIQRLAILFFIACGGPALQADPQTPYEIPLYIFNIGANGKKEFKVGIRLQVGSVNDGNTSPWRMYEFDTGGTGFFAFPYSSTQNSTGSYTLNYASGNSLSGDASSTGITFENASGGAQASTTANVVLITGASGSNVTSTLNNWTNLLPSQAPLEEFFYGDFGMSLASLEPTITPNPTLYSVIPQLFGPQNKGFVINLGPRPTDTQLANPGPFGEVSRGTIQVGLTDAQRLPSAWTSAIAMNPPTGGTFPNSGLPVYSEILSSGNLTVTGVATQAVGIVYDTGAPDVEIHPVGSATGLQSVFTDALAAQGPVQFRLDGQPFDTNSGSTILDFTVANAGGLNKVGVSPANAINSPGLYVNSGITAFFDQQVIFDLENGFVGFAPIPEPSASALLAVVALAGFLWQCSPRRKLHHRDSL